MRILFYHLLSMILLSTSLFVLHHPTDQEESVTLPEVNLISHPHIYSILKRVAREARSSTTDRVHYLTVRLENDSAGIRMEVVAHVKKNLHWYEGYSNYTEILDLPVVFINNSNVKLECLTDRVGIFPMANRYAPPIVYDPDEWLFILKDNGYYRYYYGRGWVWFQYDNSEIYSDD